jgi:hypothetical protein
VPRSRRGDGWDALADIEVFVFAVEAELEAMDRERVGVHRRGRKPDLALRRRLIGLIWTLTFGGMQWRVAGWLSGVPFTTLHSSLRALDPARAVAPAGPASGPRLAAGLRRRGPALGGGGRQPLPALGPERLGAGHRWRQAGQGPEAVRVCDKHGSLLDLELQPANTDDRAGILPTLPRLAALGFEGDLLGDSGFKGAPFAEAALEHDIHVSVSPGGTRDGRFLPSGHQVGGGAVVRLVSRYRRLNIVYDRAPDLFAAHVWIAMVSIISRRLVAQTQAQ